MYTTWKIDRYAFDETSGTHSSTVTETLSGYYDVIVRARLGSGKDTFEFKLQNNNQEYDNYFTTGDKFLIYRAVNTSSITSTDILMTATTNDLPFNKEVKSIQRVSGNNYSEAMTSAITFVDGSNLPINQFMQEAINAVNNFNPSFQITWSSTNPTSTTSGAAFPNGERWFNKSILQLMERYSSKTYTNDVNYYWYINASNELIWQPEVSSSVVSFDSSSDTYLSMKSKKDTKSVVNFVIVKGDTSPSGKIIQTRVDNAVSRVKNGFKPYIITSVANYGKELVESDRAAYPTSFDEGDTNPNTYNFTTSWTSKINRASSPTMVVGNNVTVSSNKEYNIAVTEQAKYELQQEANRYLEERGDGKVQLEVRFKPGDTPNGSIWRIGDVVNVTIPELGKTTDPMRVESAEYSTLSETYTLIEDEGTI